MDFLAWFVWEKKLKQAIYVGSMLCTSTTCGRLYVCTVYPYLFVLYYLRFPRDLQFRVIHICIFSMIMALWKKRVRTSHDRLKIIHEVEKKVCHLYWKVMNHAMYTTQTRQGYSSTCFLKEP
jgi:ribosomal protein L32